MCKVRFEIRCSNGLSASGRRIETHQHAGDFKARSIPNRVLISLTTVPNFRGDLSLDDTEIKTANLSLALPQGRADSSPSHADSRSVASSHMISNQMRRRDGNNYFGILVQLKEYLAIRTLALM
jgi:hypothetical protein